jgi:recombination protein RecA
MGLDPESAAAAGVELSRPLWVRCGVPDVSDILSSSQPAFVLPDKYFVPPPIKKKACMEEVSDLILAMR